jgi:predicted acylesterase/phospholipase RssA
MLFAIIAVFILVLIVVVAAAAAKIKAADSGASETKADPGVYFLKKSLFTPAERSFFGVLESLDYEGLTIASKVRLADIFGIKKGLERGERQRAQNKINMKHVDFLLIQKSDGKPVLGIELDDSSHEEEDRATRDAFVDTVFASAALPILHVPVKQAYDPKEIHRLIDGAISK